MEPNVALKLALVLLVTVFVGFVILAFATGNSIFLAFAAAALAAAGVTAVNNKQR